jgi:outer membrane protein TolC
MKATLQKLRQRAGLVLANGALIGCAAGPNFIVPQPPSEKTYIATPVQAFGSAGPADPEQRLAVGAPPRADWWTSLHSPELDQVVALALENNPTLEIARANLASAAEMIAAATGARYPQIDSANGVGRTRYGAAFLGPEGATYPVFSAYSVGVDVKYDFDVFGSL